jgi:hypothetical protein
MLTTDSTVFRDADQVVGLDARATWNALAQGNRRQRAALSRGLLEAPAIVGAEGQAGPDQDAIENGVLMLAPPCRFCDLHGLCGRSFEVG